MEERHFFRFRVVVWGVTSCMSWPEGELRALRLDVLDERYRRYRLVLSSDEQAMARSLARYGQVSPIVVCVQEEVSVLLFEPARTVNTGNVTETRTRQTLDRI